MKLTKEQIDIIKIIVSNELEYYENESGYDKEYIDQLKKILKKLEKESD